uniref:Uncharacterized protein n=1 Tax=Kryptolebias marmoratus TaxID=37003 RepID=A0A3Q2ZWV4_KRYMA
MKTCSDLPLFVSACSLPFLQPFPEDVIMKMSDHMKETNYADGEFIIHQGATGDAFYIISKGQVTVTEKKLGQQEEMVMAELSDRQWFGEKALWGEDTQIVSVRAAGDVTCFVHHIQILSNTEQELILVFPPIRLTEDPALLVSSTLSDFQIIRTLGVGEFGHVDLVQLKSSIKYIFAMRVLKKKLITSSGQREHILRERSILMETRCPFIVRLHKTFRDAEHLYLLTEACLGRDLSCLLKDKGFLGDCSSRFYTACVVEALSFLHHRGVVHRDVRPENVVLDERGYAKLVTAVACMKRVETGKRTWTFCGTPGYVAPEIILNQGHSTLADLWSMGVFVFELLSGGLPFDGSDLLTILTAAVRGVDQIEFPKIISVDACNLIQKLCRSNPSKRLGSRKNWAKDVQKHKWFEGFHWDALCKRTMTPPLIPKVRRAQFDSLLFCDHFVF